MSTHEYRFEELEVYRTALEFRYIAVRIERALPGRKRDVKNTLIAASAGLVNEIVGAASQETETPCFNGAHAPLSTCQNLLDQLQMIRMGPRADVTAGIEILERIAEMLGLERKRDY